MKKHIAIFGLIAVILVSLAIVFTNLFVEVDDGYRSSRERSWIKKFDKDGDGELSREERKAAAETAKSFKEKWIKKFDKDGDGELSREERKAAGKAEKKKWDAVNSKNEKK